MKGAVREPVDERDVQPLAIEERPELGEPIALEQLTGVAGGEPQSEAERARTGTAVRFNAGANCRRLSMTAIHPSAGWMFVQ